METPKVIKDILDDLGFNQAEKFEFNGNIYWSLGLVDDDGAPLPTGKPVIYQERNDGKFFQLNFDQVQELLSNL